MVIQTPALTEIEDDEACSGLMEELSDMLSEAATELLETGMTDEIRGMLSEVNKGMESIESYLGIDSYEEEKESDD